MDKDRIKGKVKDIAGRAERQAGEWSGSKEHQAEGALKQAEGKAQNTVGKVKDAARDAEQDLKNRDQQQRPKQRRAA